MKYSNRKKISKEEKRSVELDEIGPRAAAAIHTFQDLDEIGSRAAAAIYTFQDRFRPIWEKILENPNADGWIRLCEILDEAMQDKRIASSSGASSFLRLMREISSDAYLAVNEREALEPVVKVLKSEEQSRIAKRPRSKLTDDGVTLKNVIENLAKRKDETAAELWPQLYSKLDELGLNPKEVEDSNDQKKTRYDYGDRKHITFGQFANRISEIRKKSG